MSSSIMLTTAKISLSSKDICRSVNLDNIKVKQGLKFNLKKDKGIRCKLNYISSMYIEMMKMIIEDVSRGYTVYLDKAGDMKFVPSKKDMSYIELNTQYDKLQGLDFLKTNFKVFVPELKIRYSTGTIVTGMIRYGGYFDDIICEENNNGFKIKEIRYVRHYINEVWKNHQHLDHPKFVKAMHSVVRTLKGVLRSCECVNLSNNIHGVLAIVFSDIKSKELKRRLKHTRRINNGTYKYDGYFYYVESHEIMFRSIEMLKATCGLNNDIYRIKIGNCAGDSITINKGIYDTTDAELFHKRVRIGLRSNGKLPDYIIELFERNNNNKQR